MDQVFYFGQVWDAQNLKLTNYTDFLDLSEAYDIAWINEILYKLYKKFNIREKFCRGLLTF